MRIIMRRQGVHRRRDKGPSLIYRYIRSPVLRVQSVYLRLTVTLNILLEGSGKLVV